MKEISDEYSYQGDIDQDLSGPSAYWNESFVNLRQNCALEKTERFSKRIGNPTKTIHGDRPLRRHLVCDDHHGTKPLNVQRHYSLSMGTSRGDFGFHEFGEQLDYVLSYSVFPQLPPPQIPIIFQNAADCFHDHSIMSETAVFADGEERIIDAQKVDRAAGQQIFRCST